MQKYSVFVTETAELEIEEHLGYIARDSIGNAVNWYDNIYKKLATLSDLALRCPIAHENPYFEFEVRCLLIDDYRAIYRIDGNTVEILHIKHPRMNR
jgi:plasmid stabilization system protein ParE